MPLGDLIKQSNSTRIQVGDAINALEKDTQQFGGTTGGTGGAYTLTFATAPTPLVNGQVVTFRAHADSSALATLNVNSSGAFPLMASSGYPIGTAEIIAGQIVQAIYYASTWVVTGCNFGAARTQGSSGAAVSTTSGTPVDLPNSSFSFTVDTSRSFLVFANSFAEFYHSADQSRIVMALVVNGSAEKIAVATSSKAGVGGYTLEHSYMQVFGAGTHTIKAQYWTPDGGTLHSTGRYYSYTMIRLK